MKKLELVARPHLLPLVGKGKDLQKRHYVSYYEQWSVPLKIL